MSPKRTRRPYLRDFMHLRGLIQRLQIRDIWASMPTAELMITPADERAAALQCAAGVCLEPMRMLTAELMITSGRAGWNEPPP